MALRKPLVINGGQIEQLQSGDTLAEVEQMQLVADAAITAGNVVYPSANDHINKAKADSATTMPPIGMATADISNGATGGVQSDGVVTLTTTQWDAIAGTTGGLTFKTIYYLSASTAGAITATAPSTVGQYVQQVGIALSTTEMELRFTQSILL